MAATDVVLGIGQIALGGTVVQGIAALLRRKSALKQLDKETDSIVVKTTNELILMLRGQVDVMKVEAEDQAARFKSMVAQLDKMTEDLAMARQQIIQLRYPRGD